MPREIVRAAAHDRARSLGWLALAWIEHFCVHGPGDVQGTSFAELPLDDEFGGIIVDSYAQGHDGRRLYDSVFVSRGKGRSKSELAGIVGLFEGFGPARFAGWAEGGERFRWRDFVYEYQPGEPMGRIITYPFIRCLATEETQTGNTYDNIHYNLTEGPLAEGLPRYAAGLTRIALPGGGEIVPSTASSSAKDGGKETFTVFDETHLYNTPELRTMYKTVDRNCRKRKAANPWAMQTSTMYQTGEDSVAEKSHERAKNIAEGLSRESRLFLDHREAPPDVDLTSREEIIAALKEVYGPFADALDLDGIVESEFWNIEKDIEESRRYFFNQPGSSRDAWTTGPEYDACVPKGGVAPVEHGEEITMFFDGSKSDDATALVGCRMSDGHPFALGLWEKPLGPAGKGWEVDRLDVDRVVRASVRDYKVLAFFGDIKEFESYVDTWALDFGTEFLIDATTGKNKHAVAYDMRARLQDFTLATERTLVDLKAKDLPLPDDKRMRRHALNARRRSNKYGVGIGKESRESPLKIDLWVCVIGARAARRQLLNSDAWVKYKARRKPGRVVGWR